MNKIVVGIKIRKVVDSDITQLEELFLITRQQTFRWEDPFKFKRKDYLIFTEGETVFVAEENEKVIGFMQSGRRAIKPESSSSKS